MSGDGGRTWSDITPSPVPKGEVLESLFFVDPDHGWVIGDDCTGGRASVFRTADGGRTWKQTSTDPTTCSAGAGLAATFVDPLRGWLVRSEPTGSGATIRRTRDGGRTWTHPHDLPTLGTVTFVDPRTGWLTGGLRNDQGAMYRTQDGGRTWSRAVVPLSGCCHRWRRVFGSPVFTDGTGILPITFRHRRRARVAFEASYDGGRSWNVAALTRRLRVHDGGVAYQVPVAVWGSQEWAVGSGASVRRTNDGGRSWRRSRVGGAGTVEATSVLGLRRAWVTAAGPGHDVSLWSTADRGTTWRPAGPFPVSNGSAVSDQFRAVAVPHGQDVSLTAGVGDVVYGVSARQGRPGGSVFRFDTSRGRVTVGRTIPGLSRADQLAVTPGAIWVAPGSSHRRGPSWLARLDPGTLRVDRRIAQPVPPTAVAVAPGSLWVAEGRRLLQLDPSSGAVRSIRSFAGHVRLLAMDPSGTRLYVSTDAPIRHDASPLFELDAGSGWTIARSSAGYADLNGPDGLAATAAGVWVTTPTGMMAGSTFLRASDLRSVAAYQKEQPNSLAVSVARGLMWGSDFFGGLACADERTGAIRGYVGTVGSHEGSGSVVATASGTYVGGWRVLYRMLPGPECRAA